MLDIFATTVNVAAPTLFETLQSSFKNCILGALLLIAFNSLIKKISTHPQGARWLNVLKATGKSLCVLFMAIGVLLILTGVSGLVGYLAEYMFAAPLPYGATMPD